MARTALSEAGQAERGLLLEREREIEALDRALSALAQGRGSILLVEGPAGIGKTRLLAAAADLARDRDLLVRSARAGELEREMPFGVARLLLEPIVERSSDEERSRLLAGSAELALAALGREDPAKANPERGPFAPIHGLYWLVANLAETAPAVLVLDDLHWSDPQSLRWLEYLARQLDEIPVTVVGGVRLGEPDEPPELEPLRLEAEVLRPAPLSDEAIERLIAAEVAPPTTEFTQACAEATAGNPFLLAEVIRTLRADDVEPSAEAADAIAGLGRESVARYVLIRLARFGEDAIALARAIAVLGGAPQLRHAAALAGLEGDRALTLCDRLREAEILAPGLPFEFVHPLIRSAIYNEYSEGERAATHRRAAELLSESGASPDEIATHLLSCPPNGDQWVVTQLAIAAAQAVSAGGFETAVGYFERALAEPPDDDVSLLFGLGMCMIQSDLERAPEVLADVAQRATDPAMRLEARRCTALAHFFAASRAESVRWFAEAVEEVPEDDREQRLITEAQYYCTKAANFGRGAEDSRRLAAVVDGATGATQGECLARQALAFDRFLVCDPVDEVIELAATFPRPPWHLTFVTPTIGLGFKALSWCGAWNEARQAIVEILDWARELGLMFGISYATAFLAEADRLAGRLVDAEGEARTALDVGNEVAPASDFVTQATTNLLATLVARGNLDDAEELAVGADLSLGPDDGAITPWPIEARGYLRLAQGRLEEGVDDLLELGEVLGRRQNDNPALTSWCQEAVPAMAAIGRADEAKVLVDGSEERARRFGAPHVIGMVLRARSAVEPRRRQLDTLRQSVRMLEQNGPPHELARSLVELGAALRRGGNRSEAREPLSRALELAARSGASGTEARAREELAAMGSRPRSAFRTGVAALTASELRTAKLAAEGLSNVGIAQRLFVSRKTVEKHLGNAYSKLEISGREELGAALEGEEDQAAGHEYSARPA